MRYILSRENSACASFILELELARMEGYLTTQQAADRLGVSAGRIRQLIADGKLPSELFGRDRMIKESDLKKVKTYGKAGRPPKASKKK